MLGEKMAALNEQVTWKSKWQIEKWLDPTGEVASFLKKGGSIEEARQKFSSLYLGQEEFEGNVALNEGLQLLIDIITGLDTTSNKWDNANARIGVGDGTTAEDPSQTGLQGTNKTFVGMDSGYPQRSGQTAKWRATFDGDTGNHSWQEFTVVNGSDDSATNLNRKVVDKGTKSAGETWTVTLEITFS